MMTKHDMTPQNRDDGPTIVGIGASAGGLEPIQDLFSEMPEQTGLAFVIIQHLSPDYKSFMAELLSRHTGITIKKAEDGLIIESDTIYLIPPRKNMTVFDNKLYLEERKPAKSLNLPIDIFFRSLAKEKGKKSIGIILSGTGSDGTLGIRAIKEAGGMTMVQSQDTAKFDGMPRSSIATGQVDYVLEPGQMPEDLLNYLKHPFIKKSKSLDTEEPENTNTLSKIQAILRDETGTDFSFYKENTIIRRIERRISINRFSNLDQYYSFLTESENERKVLYKEFLIGVTRFFRDEEAFEAVAQKVYPVIMNKTDGPIRVWTVGCSTGEEVYSLAISICEYMEKHGIHHDVKLFATDIDREAIEYAGAGFYPDSIVSDIPDVLLQKYFKRVGDGYQVSDRLRQMVVFATHNVLGDPPFPKIDLITCRNLFIYFKAKVQDQILSMFYFSLNTDGFLFLGSSEAIGEMSVAFSVIDSKHKIFSYKKGYQSQMRHKLTAPEIVKQKYTAPMHRPDGKMGKGKPAFLQEEIESVFVPPSVVVDDTNKIIKIYNDVNDVLTFPQGSFTPDLFQLVSEEMKLTLTSLLRKIRAKKKKVLYQNVKGAGGDTRRVLDVEGRPIYDRQQKTEYYLISFIHRDPVSPEEKVVSETVDMGGQYKDRVADLENELQYTKENLQATVEELETSNEELQSSNEELIASNEELQSTNEELQSVNEELYTVNSEHEKKIEELTQLNNDINNLLKNTNIGTLYLDRKLHIRKFTPVVSEITTIRGGDIGRPVSHLDLQGVYAGFLDDIQGVLDDLRPREKEVYNQSNAKWYMVRVMPYRTEDNAVEGVIVTFVEITSLKEMTRKYYAMSERLGKALELGDMAWWEWDVTTGEVVFDDKKAEMCGYRPDEFPSNVYKITELVHPDDYEHNMRAMREHLEGKRDRYESHYRIRTKDGEYRWFYDRGGIVKRDDKGGALKLTGIVIDVTRLKTAQRELEQREALLTNVLDNNPVASTMVDSNGMIVYANKRALAIFGISADEVAERRFDDSQWEMTAVDGSPLSAEELPFSRIKRTQQPVHRFRYLLKRPGADTLLLSINGTPVFDHENRVTGAVFSLDIVEQEGP